MPAFSIWSKVKLIWQLVDGELGGNGKVGVYDEVNPFSPSLNLTCVSA